MLDHYKKSQKVNDISYYSFLRYLATTSGILRMYPGSRVDKRFDPSKRPW